MKAIAIILLGGSTSSGTFNPVAGSYSAIDNDSPNASFTVTCSASVKWTWNATDTTGLSSNPVSNGNGTSIVFTLSQGLLDRSTTITLTSGSKSWTINMFVTGSGGGGTV